jgi:hypothetical protein
MTRLLFEQSARWQRSVDGGTGVYPDDRCCYCHRPTRADAVRLRTARTNDGEWWLISADEDLTTDEWRDFQSYPEGRAPTLLPVGPECLRAHPEWRFALEAV